MTREQPCPPGTRVRLNGSGRHGTVLHINHHVRSKRSWGTAYYNQYVIRTDDGDTVKAARGAFRKLPGPRRGP